MDNCLEDLRHSFRLMRRNRGFTIAAVAALALGIGANTAIFSVLNAVLLRPLPYPDADRLMVFLNISPQGSGPAASPTKFNLWRRQTGVFQDVSAYRFNFVNLTDRNNPQQLVAGRVSAPFFRLFGAPVVAGRTFSEEEARTDSPGVVVLSEGFWKRRFGGDASVVGRTMSLDGMPFEIVGVLGPFETDVIQPPMGPPEVWLPFPIDPDSTVQGHYFTVAGRLRPGTALAEAQAQLRVAADEFRRTFPSVLSPRTSFGVGTLQDVTVRNVRSSLWILAGAVGFVLLIACANVANLFLVHATVRQREIAIRVAVGAGRRRILQQLLTQSVVLSMVGGAVGMVVGLVGIRALLALNPGNIPRVGADGSAVVVDWRVLAFTALASVATGLVFGLFPAVHAARADLVRAIKDTGGTSSSGRRQQRARAVLVVGEVALALVLLIGAGLFIRTFVALRAVDPGFHVGGVVTLRMSLTGERFTKTEHVAELIRGGVGRLNALPGVETAGAACCVPLDFGLGLPFIIEGRPLQGPFHGGGGFTPVSSSYFSVFGIPMIRGRAFSDRDEGGAPGVVIINQAMARRYWPDGDPLADRLTIGKGLGPQFDEPPRQIVGIVGDVRDAGLNRDPQPTMYVPWAQLPDLHNANLLENLPLVWIVRTRADAPSLDAIESALRGASGGLPVARPRRMDDVVRRSTARSDFNTLLLTVFAASALLLASFGVFSVMAYSVQQRTQEIGIRLALGADSRGVRHMVIYQGMGVALVGVAIGLAAAFMLTRITASALFGVTPRDPVVFVAGPLVLTGIALLGVWCTARRAGRVDPVIALRTE